MTITTSHPASQYGVPVIVDSRGDLWESAHGVRKIRNDLDLTPSMLAAHCGVSARTVEGWELGRPVPAAALNVMRDLLEDSKS